MALMEIKRNIENNILQTNTEISNEEKVIRSCKIVLNNLDQVSAYNDSMDYHFMRRAIVGKLRVGDHRDMRL